MRQPGLGARLRWLQALAVSPWSAKHQSHGWAGEGCCCLWLFLLLVSSGGDETITPGQRLPILLSGRYSNDVLEYFFPNLPSIGGCKRSVIDTSPGQGLPWESGSGAACPPLPSPTHAAGPGVSKPTAGLGWG